MLLPLIAIGADWWLPPNYARHGVAIDRLFDFIFALVVIIAIGVQVALVAFVVRYRRRTGRAVTYTHGSRRLEWLWTVLTLAILLSLAGASTRVWDQFRDSPTMHDPGRTKILVIGQQFKWNIIYPGPDGKFGRYLQFPKPTDLLWPIGADGKRMRFAGVAGPAFLPPARAQPVIGQYVDTVNPLGKDFSDPAGSDDNYQDALARTLYVPVNRPVEISVMSKDVIHDLYLPNFRAQIYATPGMTSSIVFTATQTNAQIERASRRIYSVATLPALLATPATADLSIAIDAGMAGAVHNRFGWRYVSNPTARHPTTLIRNGSSLSAASAKELLAAGIKTVTAYKPADLTVACLQLCGAGHYTMQSKVVVLSQKAFDEKFPAAPYVKESTKSEAPNPK